MGTCMVDCRNLNHFTFNKPQRLKRSFSGCFARIAIFICFDINFFELWHQAYAIGAQVVFWPSAMQTPDRDMISLARLYRYHIVANGYPGDIVNGLGRRVDDFKVLPGGAQWCKNTPDATIHDCGVRTGTLDLDATWVHENGPGPLNCGAIAAMCKDHPGVFELAIPSCGQFWNHLKPCDVGCSCGQVAPGESVKTDNSVFVVRSKQPEKFSVRAAFRRYGVVPYHDYIKGSRQGLNALRQARADIPRPPPGAGTPGSTPSLMPPCPTITHENVCVLPLCEWQSGKCVAAPPPPPPPLPPPCPAVPAPCPAPPSPKCPPTPRDVGAQPRRYWRLHTVPGADEGQTKQGAPSDWATVARLWDVCAVDFFTSSDGTGPSAIMHNSTTQNAIQGGAKNPGVARDIFDFHAGPASQCGANSTTWNGIWQVQETANGRCGCRAPAYIGWDFGKANPQAIRSVAIRQFFSLCQNVLVVQSSDDQKCWYLLHSSAKQSFCIGVLYCFADPSLSLMCLALGTTIGSSMPLVNAHKPTTQRTASLSALPLHSPRRLHIRLHCHRLLHPHRRHVRAPLIASFLGHAWLASVSVKRVGPGTHVESLR